MSTTLPTNTSKLKTRAATTFRRMSKHLTFSDKDPTPHLVITTNDQGDWGEWDNQPAGFTTASKYVLDKGFKTRIGWVPTLVEAENIIIEQNQMRGILEWPVDRSTGDLDRRGADVLSGFSGQPMADPGADPVLDEAAGQFIDASSGTAEGDRGNDKFDSGGKYDDDYELTGGVTIIGTDDPATTPETADNYYLHELGHVLGAIHPKQDADESEFEVPPDEPGVMCKESCKVEAGTRITAESYINTVIGRGSPVANFNPDVDLPTGTILDSYSFSEANRERILNLDYDHKDGDGEKSFEPPDGENPVRNLTTVATAATGEPE